MQKSGTIKWYSQAKGYGFIAPDDGWRDVFVHIPAVESAGYLTLPKGAQIQYHQTGDRGRPRAENLQLARDCIA